MKHPVFIALTLLAAAGGFTAGWLPPSGQEKPAAAHRDAGRETTAAASLAINLSAEDLPPALPELLTVEDCREFLRASAKQFAPRHPLTRQAVRDFALRRWLELDAESALQEAERQPGNEFADTGFAPELFRVWLDLHVDSAIEGWTQANPLLARNVRTAFLTALAEKDPARAFQLWQTPRGRSPNEFYDPVEDAIYQRWAQQDPAGALKQIASPRSAPAVWKAWAAADPAVAFSELRKVAPDLTGIGPDVSAQFLPWLLQHSPADAATLIHAVQATTAAGYARSVAEDWINLDAAGAVQWALTQPSANPLALEVTAGAARQLATSDPIKAIALLQRFESSAPQERVQQFRSSEKTQALREAFAALAATDSAKAQELLAANPELAKSGGLAGCLTHSFAGDLDTAITYTRQWLRDPALKEAAAEGALMAFNWSRGAGVRDPSALLAAIPELADKVDSDLLSGWAKANPTGAADFISEQLRAGHEIAGLQDEGVLAELAISQPEYSSLWLQSLPDGQLQQQAAETLAANWSAFDPEAAAAWIQSLPAGPVKDAAISSLQQQLEER